MPETPKPGIYPGVPFAEYRSWEAVNWHTLWRLLEESPAHAKYEMENGTDETEALAFGALTDFIVLEPARFEEQAVIEPEIGDDKAPKRPTKRQREAKKPSPASVEAIRFWNEWDAANAGKIVVTAEDYNTVMRMAGKIRTAQCRELICGGRSQVCVVWIDPVTELLCKGRLDYERSGGRSDWNHYITDLKTARSAQKRAWKRAVRMFGYRGQMAFYHDGWMHAAQGETSICLWLVAEKHGACVVKGWEATLEDLEIGRKQYRAALDRWAECVKDNDWPDYGKVELLGPDDWELQEYGIGKYQVQPEAQSEVNYTTGPEPEPDEFDTFMDAK